MKNTLRGLLLQLVALSLFITAPLAPVQAAIVGTEQAMALDAQAATMADVTAALQREDVRAQLATLGVDPDQALDRVQGLTAEELAALDGQLQDLPAGGSVLGILGAVLIVMVILDMVGVTNIFSKL